jgi:hypothetical protein
MANIYRNNIIKEGSKAHGDITANYTDLIDLGDDSSFKSIIIENTTNQELSLKFGSNEITIATSKTLTFNNFFHGGTIQVKHNGAAPGSGKIVTRSWK